MDVSAHPQPPDVAPRRRRARRLTLASVLALALLGVAASAAQAEPTVGNAELTCKTITVTYSGFPAGLNTIKEKVRIDGVKNAVTKTFTFAGPEGTDKIEINLPPGEHSIDLFSIWKTNGVSGNRDQFLGKIKCLEPEPGIAAEKFQKYSTKEKYTQETLKLGHVGNVVDYKVVVKNTGNVPLNVEFKDPKCDEGTITGGPTTIPRFGTATFFCTHTITSKDQEEELLCNTATVKGTPEEGEEVTAESNTVCVEVPDPKSNTTFSCKKFEVTLSGFPANVTNKVKIKITVDHKVVVEEVVTFTGPEHTFTYELNLSPGHHQVDVFVIWKTNGFSGNRDQTLANGINCIAEPGFSIVKSQKIEGSAEPFTTEEINGLAGQTVDYQIVITNTGNTTLTVTNFSDAKCENLSGPTEPVLNPAAFEVPPGTATYTCEHLLTLQDEIEGEYTNSASATAAPPVGQGGPVTNESNTVVVDVGELT
jgi:uncharacterized repeat protein (TIGR01451 family)